MTSYLSYTFEDSPEFVSTFDELPLWSASFGLFMLEHLQLRPSMTVIDIGSGAGFPLLEIAERLGSSCRLFGIDPWHNACERARQKIRNYGITNVEIIESSAETLPFDPNSVDLVVSNLGINNFSAPPAVFKECHRVLKHGGRLALTTNLNGHWKEFYDLFEATLVQLERIDLVDVLTEHQQHRGSEESVEQLFNDGGFKVVRHEKQSFQMKFVDGSAFLNHHFVKLGWLDSWRELLPSDQLEEIFSALEQNLNEHAVRAGGLSLSVPMLFMEGEKR